MKKQRPINLNIMSMQFPLTAISSILHRVSGIIIFIMISGLLWLLQLSLSSPEGFLKTISIIKNLITKFILWIILTALVYHILAGIRHIMMDCNVLTKNLKTGKISSLITFALTIALSIFSGVLLW